MSDVTMQNAPAVDAAPVETAPASAGNDTPVAKPEDTKDAAPESKDEAPTQEVSSKEPVDADVDMTDAPAPAAAADPKPETTEPNGQDANKTTSEQVATSKAPRRKSTGPAASAKKLNKKASKARITHLDAKPGDHFFVKLKGFPQWPAIICDEDMLPQALLDSRPVTAKRADGTYREDYADGGKRAGDRTFPVMYLYTNEFGWVPNTDLVDLNTETVLDVKMDKMRKDLQNAYKLAAESHPLSYFKGVLQAYQDEMLAKQEAKAAATPAKKKKVEDDDLEMGDMDDEEGTTKKKSTKKRKADENAETPQRSDSVKKPKIKLTTNSTPKANGAATPKSAKTGDKAKAKGKKAKEEDKVEKEASVPKEPELTAEEKHQRKEKEVLFLRHKLQKGLLTRDQEPKEEEMSMMSEYMAKLESLPNLEVSIIRVTKINKVLKGILKLANIPREAEFKLKPRSQVLLDQWNKLLLADDAAPADAPNGAKAKEEKSNGIKENGASKAEAAETAEKAGKPEAAEEEKPESAKTEPVEASA